MLSSPKTALVTGAARRIGRAIAVDLARSGWAVAVHYNRSASEAEAVVEEIRRVDGRAVALRADLASEAEVEGLVGAAAEALGPLGCLVNNASLFERDSAESASRASWDAHMNVNLRAPFVLSQRFARQLPSEASGCIVNILDERVWSLTPNFVSYTVSKSGLWALTRVLALALSPRIRVNGIGPGPALMSAHQTPEQFALQESRTPLRRGSTPEEIAAAVRYLLSAPAVTGQMLALDGGMHLGWVYPTPDDPAAQD